VQEFGLSVSLEERDGVARAASAVRVGIPFPRGLLETADEFEVVDASGRLLPHQARVLTRWPDATIKWLLFDVLVTIGARERKSLTVRPGRAGAHGGGAAAPSLVLVQELSRIDVDTGAAKFTVDANGGGPLAAVRIGATDVLGKRGSQIALVGADGREYTAVKRRMFIEESGSLRATVVSEGQFTCRERTLPLVFRSRAVFVAGSASVELEFQIRNPEAAHHPGGLWDLGDAGSCFFKDLSVRVHPAEPARSLRWSARLGASARMQGAREWILYQDSSGGERWNSHNHIDRNGELTVAFRGYEVWQAEADEAKAGAAAARQRNPLETGLRATPCLQVVGHDFWVAATTRDFWQNFPQALRWQASALSVGLSPGESRPGFELQGGEQKRHTVFLDFGRSGDATRIPELQCRLAAWVDPVWVERSQVIPYFTASQGHEDEAYHRYVGNVVEGPNSFFAKREIIDEYGWRNFGDLYADHEAVNHPGPEPLVSHYNNQYDFIYGAGVQFLRTGDWRWRELMEDAARHTIDIDVYHTQADKTAFNGGLFWHTDHYKPAARCTHRTYSHLNAAGSDYGGGPSNEHNYTSGLLLHYWLSGDEEARATVLQLADWVLAMDDGSRTLVGLIDPRPTGLASKTVRDDYHKPGRGAGNSINALLDAHSISGERRYLRKAQELIHRCVHPADDIERLDLDAPEHRWSYLVFLQILGKYLDIKLDLGERDYDFHYARESLLHYAGWMVRCEVPYKDVLHKVEIPTETWSAHDVRKGHVLAIAAKYAPPGLRLALRERAEFFFERCVEDLLSFDTAYLTRPLVILCVYGHTRGYFAKHANVAVEVGSHNYAFGQPTQFVSQRDNLVPALRAKCDLIGAELRRIVRDQLHGLRRRFRKRRDFVA
jgi:hypothetical protein